VNEGKLSVEMMDKHFPKDSNLSKISIRLLGRQSISNRITLENNLDKCYKNEKAIIGFLDKKMIRKFFEIDSLKTIEICNFHEFDSDYINWKKGMPKNLEYLNLSKSSIGDRFIFELR
jgi:hypothetical protein